MSTTITRTTKRARLYGSSSSRGAAFSHAFVVAAHRARQHSGGTRPRETRQRGEEKVHDDRHHHHQDGRLGKIETNRIKALQLSEQRNNEGDNPALNIGFAWGQEEGHQQHEDVEPTRTTTRTRKDAALPSSLWREELSRSDRRRLQHVIFRLLNDEDQKRRGAAPLSADNTPNGRGDKDTLSITKQQEQQRQQQRTSKLIQLARHCEESLWHAATSSAEYDHYCRDGPLLRLRLYELVRMVAAQKKAFGQLER